MCSFLQKMGVTESPKAMGKSAHKRPGELYGCCALDEPANRAQSQIVQLGHFLAGKARPAWLQF